MHVLLSKGVPFSFQNAFPVSGLFSTHVLSLDALLAVIDSIEQHCHHRVLHSSRDMSPDTEVSQSDSPERTKSEGETHNWQRYCKTPLDNRAIQASLWVLEPRRLFRLTQLTMYICGLHRTLLCQTLWALGPDLRPLLQLSPWTMGPELTLTTDHCCSCHCGLWGHPWPQTTAAAVTVDSVSSQTTAAAVTVDYGASPDHRTRLQLSMWTLGPPRPLLQLSLWTLWPPLITDHCCSCHCGPWDLPWPQTTTAAVTVDSGASPDHRPLLQLSLWTLGPPLTTDHYCSCHCGPWDLPWSQTTAEAVTVDPGTSPDHRPLLQLSLWTLGPPLTTDHCCSCHCRLWGHPWPETTAATVTVDSGASPDHRPLLQVSLWTLGSPQTTVAAVSVASPDHSSCHCGLWVLPDHCCSCHSGVTPDHRPLL